jgi:phosphatidate phosphatase APP1
MAGWKHILGNLARGTEIRLDRLKYRLAYRLGGPDPICIVTYRGFGTRDRVVVRGRVLEDQGILPARDDDSRWRNLLNTWRRFETDEVPDARLRVRVGGEERDTVADEEGHFDLALDLREPLPPDVSLVEAEVELLAPRSPKQTGVVRTIAEILVPSSRAAFGVISDIDDTVVLTDTAHRLRMARALVLGSARTRAPFAGAAAFYRALHAGINPLFYVSNGPVNLDDLLADYLDRQGFPPKPVVFLRNWGLDEFGLLPTDRGRHKLAVIGRLLAMYPDLPFLLLGDSGEQDPEIYRDVVRAHGRRILGVLIRDVGERRRAPEAMRAIADEIAGLGSALVVAGTSREMAQYAARHGWIDAASLPEIDG